MFVPVLVLRDDLSQRHFRVLHVNDLFWVACLSQPKLIRKVLLYVLGYLISLGDSISRQPLTFLTSSRTALETAIL